MSKAETEIQKTDTEIMVLLDSIKSNNIRILRDGEIKKKTRRDCLKTIKIVDKIKNKTINCQERTGNLEGLVVTLAKGNISSRRMRCAMVIVGEMVDNSEPDVRYGKPGSRYYKEYYRISENLYVENTLHHPKVQSPKIIRIVGKNILKTIQ